MINNFLLILMSPKSTAKVYKKITTIIFHQLSEFPMAPMQNIKKALNEKIFITHL